MSDVLATKRELPTASIDSAYRMFLAEKALTSDASTLVAKIGEGALPQEGVETLRIAHLSNVAGVNNLASGQEIAFNPRFTLLFGENAAGKTGYVRVLKRVSCVRNADQILGNVYAAAVAPSPTATISYRLNDKDGSINWKNETGVPPLTRISVFDSDAVALHIDEDLTYAFTPGELALFRYTHLALEAVKTRLEAARKEVLPGPNPFIARFQRDTVVYPRMEVLSAAADLAELDTLAAVTPGEEQELQPLRDRVAALQSPTTDARLRLSIADTDLLKPVQRICQTVSSVAWSEYGSKVEAVRQARERYQGVSKTAFAGESVPGLFGEAWREFVRTGEAYLRETVPHDETREGDPCPYCRRPLVEKALALVRKYRDYTNNEPRQALDAALDSLHLLVAAFVNLRPNAAQEGCEKRGVGSSEAGPLPTLLPKAIAFLSQVASAQALVAAGEPFEGEPLKAAAVAIEGETKRVIHSAEHLAETLRGESEERKKLLEADTARLRTLENRLLLRALLAEIRRRVEAEKWAAVARTLLEKRLPPLLRSLTERSKEASKKLLDQDFGRLFEEECKALRAPKVRLDFAGRRGEAARTKVVAPNRRPSEILSEGEQRVIALADFLAETALHHKAAPIVFDDPVNSLDYQRLRYVVDRLVDLSKSRQVIVFTHNIWFAAEILSRFEKAVAECTYYGITEGAGAVGFVNKGTHPRWDTVAKLAKRVNEILLAAVAATGEAQSALIESAYGTMRSWCEVVAEQELLAGVTQRYRPNVSMTKLSQIKVEKLGAARDVIFPLFEKACRVMPDHSQPLETLSVRPTLIELKDDWRKAQEAREAYIA